MRIFNGTYPLGKRCKISNMKIEILRIHEDYVLNNNNFCLDVTEWLACPDGTKFSKPIEEMSKVELNVFRKSFCTSARNKDGKLSVYKSS